MVDKSTEDFDVRNLFLIKKPIELLQTSIIQFPDFQLPVKTSV